MKPNVSEQEAKIRIGVGIAAGMLAMTTRSRIMSAFLGAVAASGIETGLSRYCPLSEYLGVDNAPELTETPIKKISKSVASVPALH